MRAQRRIARPHIRADVAKRQQIQGDAETTAEPTCGLVPHLARAGLILGVSCAAEPGMDHRANLGLSKATESADCAQSLAHGLEEVLVLFHLSRRRHR
jgi:hypothetical protein